MITTRKPSTSTDAATPRQFLVADPGKTLHLAETFQPDVDMLVAEGLIAFGVKGSGKSNLVARTAEQLGRFFLPQVILDTDREYLSLLEYLPHGMIATANKMPSGYDVPYRGLQVIVDLRSWHTDDAAALAVVQLIGELFTVAGLQEPQERVPCVVHLDEAGYWLPQESVPYLTKRTRLALLDAFHRLAARGRKLGLTPFIYTQSISEVSKAAIRQAGVKVLMRQTLDIDIERYCTYIRGATDKTKKAIPAFGKGKAIVILPDGKQQVVQFHERQSEHVSHAPLAQAALAKFATSEFDQAPLQARDLSPIETAPAPETQSTDETSELDSAIEAEQEQESTTTQMQPTGHSSKQQTLAEQVRNSVVAQRIRACLTEDPTLTISQIAKRVHNPYRDVKMWLERIREADAQAQQQQQ